jgi:hypothetical protein
MTPAPAIDPVATLAADVLDYADRVIAYQLLKVGQNLGMPPEEIEAVFLGFDTAQAIAAAFANESVRRFRADPQSTEARLWNDQHLLTRPPLRVEFSGAWVYASVGEAGQMARSKSWGKRIVSLQPLRTFDELHPFRIVYSLKPSAPQRQRWEWRDTLRAILG